MSRVRGTLARVALAVAALLFLAALPIAVAEIAVHVDAPLIPATQLDLSGAGAAPLDVGIDTPLIPATLDLPLVGVNSPSHGHGAAAPAPGPAPSPSPTAPDLGQSTGLAVRHASGAAVMGALAVTPALPWESVWAALAQWGSQARQALRPLGRALKALPFFAPLFSRIGGERLLENPVRARVNDAIAQDPGLSVQDVRDRAGVAWGTTVHHLARLERHGLVVSVRHGNHRRYFPANTSASKHRRELSALSHPTAHRIATQVSNNPGSDQKTVCRALDLQNPAASKHLSRFETLGLVQTETVGRSRLYHPTELLRAVLQTLEGLGGLAPAAPVANSPANPRPAPRIPLAQALPDISPVGNPEVALAS